MLDPAKIIEAIDDAYRNEPPRRGSSRLGASLLGNGCDAYLSLCLRGGPEDQPDPSLKRIFGLGHHIEDKVIKDLRKAGLYVVEKDYFTGKQKTFEAYEGHVVCKLDGIVESDEGAVGLEIKSMNKAMWSKFQNHGLAVSHPEYVVQCMAMMGMSGLRKFLVVAYCKDNSKYHAELIHFDEFAWAYIRTRIERVLAQGDDVKRVASTENDWRCEGCFKKPGCWGGVAVEPKCSMCEFAMPATNRGWYCTKQDRDVTEPCSEFKQYVPKAR